MIFQDAYEAAQNYLDSSMRKNHALEIVIGSCSEYPNAWVFGYNTRRFWQGDFMASLVGNGPVVVPKSGGEPFLASSATPVEEQLRDL
ncbi:YrhB domain-containing protein [Micromonospora sp. NPDC048930]|uniref:YrhB domain-containing protein n=1 Tax=Micromonospora sp. NPDC048930 TaxID=3364261 RepID=UPI003722CD13